MLAYVESHNGESVTRYIQASIEQLPTVTDHHRREVMLGQAVAYAPLRGVPKPVAQRASVLSELLKTCLCIILPTLLYERTAYR